MDRIYLAILRLGLLLPSSCLLACFSITDFPGMLTKALDQRSDAIARELEEARKLRAEAESLLADYKQRAENAQKEAQESLRRPSATTAYAENRARLLTMIARPA